MRPPGKTVVDEYYIHLSALEQVENSEAKHRIKSAVERLPVASVWSPNVAKLNLRSGRISLLSYPDFFDSPFPVLAAAWVFSAGSSVPTWHRTYADSLNPPILHRKELLLPSSHPQYERWARITATAESLGLFDDVATIGFQLNWSRLIQSKGYDLVGDEFLPIGNDLSDEVLASQDPDEPIQRHLTALSRTNLSAPVQMLVRHGLLRADTTFFDYGCGRGGDVCALGAEGIDSRGWDPHYLPDAPITPANVVNLGFVVNVIEDPAERIEAITKAFQLAQTVLSVGVMLYGGDIPGRPYRDGFLTSRNTFQKYFTQSELKDYIELALQRNAFMVGPGVALVFASTEAEQRFSAGRYRRKNIASRLLVTRAPRPVKAKPVRESKTHEPRAPRQSRAEQELDSVRPQLDRLWETTLDLGRVPEADEVRELSAIDANIGSLSKAIRLMVRHHDVTKLQAAAEARADDVRLLMATQQFSKRPAYRHLESRLQRDIKAFFGDYRSARAAGLRLLLDAADPAKILAACRLAATQGLGWLEAEHSLQLHVSMVERLPVLLRAYVICGLIIWDAVSDVQLVKIHIASGKLTLMEFDDFDDTPLPLLRRRIKVQVRRVDYETFEYGSSAYPKPVLYRKSRYLNEDYPGYAEQLAFDESLDRCGFLNQDDHGPSLEQLRALLNSRRMCISGTRLVRSLTIPDLDSPCGENLTYRALIECGETRRRLGIANLPLRPESYNALYDLATQLLDPIIDYFGSIRLTYGFATSTLTKHIQRGIAPKLDQHAACEHDSRGISICHRGGAACDFIVEFDDMMDVADWIISNLKFDRLYFYGPDRPIHVSYSLKPQGEAISMVRTESGRLVPRLYAARNTSAAKI